MISLFGRKKPDHPMADIKETHALLADLPTNDPIKSVEELTHWLESVTAEAGFKPEYRAQLIQLLDETAQPQLRRLTRDYLSSPRLAKFQEFRLWTAIFEYWHQAGRAYVGCTDLFAEGAKGADALKGSMPLLLTRALRALAAEVKWMHMRYGPMDSSVWGVIAKVYMLAESRKFAHSAVPQYPGIPGESTPEQEFLKVAMLSASSLDSLLPVEIELCERLIAHFSTSFTLLTDLQPDAACWIDLATGEEPLRLGRLPHDAPTLRFFGAGQALQDLGSLSASIKASGSVPPQVNLGGTYPAETVLDVLNHMAMYLSSKPPERRYQRHRVKSRLTVVHGFESVLAVLGGTTDEEVPGTETWIVENVSTGGFGAGIPEIKGDWLTVGCLVGLQPEGGDNWVLGIVRRLRREIPHKGVVGIETIAKSAQLAHLSYSGSRGGETGIIIDSGVETPGEARVLLPADAFAPGRNLEYRKGETTCLLMPQTMVERGDEYELVKFREMIREASSDD